MSRTIFELLEQVCCLFVLTSRAQCTNISFNQRNSSLFFAEERFFTMRSISIRDDIEEVIVQLVCAIPEVFLSYDPIYVELVDTTEDGQIYSADIVFVEDEETELVLGEVRLGSDLIAEIEIFED